MERKRSVILYAWYRNPSSGRTFCVVDKLLRNGETVGVKLVEHLNPFPIQYDIADFWQLVDQKKLIEQIPV